MTGIVILNVALVVGAVAGIVGLLSWAIVSSMDRPARRRAQPRPSNQRRAVARVDWTLVRNK
jgi:hypothetical protein